MIIQVLDTTREISSLSDLKDIAAEQSGEDLSEWTVTNVCSKRQKIEPGLISMQDLMLQQTTPERKPENRGIPYVLSAGRCMLLAGGELFLYGGGDKSDHIPCSFPLR